MKRKIAPTAPAIVPCLFTVPQAAQYLGSSPWAIRKLHWEALCAVSRLDARLLFDKAGLDAYVDRLLKEATSTFP
jgi:hypothetical protein